MVEEQRRQWPKEKEQKNKQRSTTPKDRVTRTPLKPGVNAGAPEG